AQRASREEAGYADRRARATGTSRRAAPLPGIARLCLGGADQSAAPNPVAQDRRRAAVHPGSTRQTRPRAKRVLCYTRDPCILCYVAQEATDMEKYIDLTPTWEALLPAMIAVLRNPDASCEAVRTISDELAKLARCADREIARRKGEQK